MWPFTDAGSGGLVLVLYVLTLALHAVFIGYVVGGTAYALARPSAPLAAIVRDRLAFMLGCGITAGVAPLLFVQLLHQHRFYTASLLLGPRWMAVVPALIVGFYALYAVKTPTLARFRRPMLAVALVCFAFVGWSWSELHELMKADSVWRDFYAAGDRVFLSGMLVPRFVLFAGAMATTFAMVAAWSSPMESRKQLAAIAVLARLISIGAAIWLWQAGFAADGPARAWAYVLIGAVVVEVVAWLGLWRNPESQLSLALATGASTGAIVAAVIVREAPRVALIEPTHALAANAGGTLVFVFALLGAVAAVTWVIRTVRA